MASTGLLVITNLSRVSQILSAARNHINKTLYVQLFPSYRNSDETKAPPFYSRAVTAVYTQALKHCDNIDVRIILSSLKHPNEYSPLKRPVDVVIFDNSLTQNETTDFLCCYLRKDVPVIFLKDSNTDRAEGFSEVCETTAEPMSYNNVVLGGTFDRLHIGHKILLSEAMLRATKRVVVGVTEASILKSKILHELILPCSERISNVHDFMKDVDHTLNYEVVPISDAFGPTKSDPDMQLIVVSQETLKGGYKVNEVRMENGLGHLKIHCIELIEATSVGEGKERKIASSNQRMDLLGTRLREPCENKNIAAKPYVIGLCGGIASGKSSVAQRLHKLGAAYINCDLLAHDLYKPGQKCHQLVKQEFGCDVFNSDDTLNRHKLGSIVFGNKDKLKKLNEIVWPLLLEELKTKIANMHHEMGADVFIVEAAVLIQADWENEFHEIWSCIIPEKEAIKRLQERNKLSEDDAKVRLEAQPCNTEFVTKSNVVFCTNWSRDYTQTQVEKAWSLLQQKLSKL